MDLNELSNFDFQDVGRWPAAARLIAVLLICVGVIGLGFWFDTREQLGVLDLAEQKEAELKSTFEYKQQKAANLEAYKEQLGEMRQTFGALLKQLPSKTEVAELLVDISQTGLASGLEFELFKPESESPKEFYAELPIQIKVTGSYHEFGAFVSGIAALPRIVTLHDVQIEPVKDVGGELTMQATAKTYRYLGEDEMQGSASQAANAKGAK